MEISPPVYVNTVLAALSDAGYTSCIVGGCVRDMALGVVPNDWDVATSALPARVMEIFPVSAPTGLQHGTVTVKVGSEHIEVTTFRIDGGYADHRHPDSVSFTGNLVEDLSRRDFTINAMAITADGNLVDPFDGMADLHAGIIRCVGDPKKRFEEDALRMLRAFRFSSRLGFSIEAGTFRAIEANAPLARSLAAERVRDEVEKILLTAHPEEIFRLISCGLLDIFLTSHLPGASLLTLFPALSKEAVHRWAALCFLLEKEGCIGSPAEFLRALKLDNHCIRCASDAAALMKAPIPADAVAWKQLLRRFGLETVEIYASNHDGLFGGSCQSSLAAVLSSGECFCLADLAIGGDDLMTLGISGRQIGEALNLALDRVIAFPSENNKKKLISFLEESLND